MVTVDDGTITLIEDADVSCVVANLSPAVKGAVEGHLDWLRTGGQEGERAALRGSDLHGVELSRINLCNVDLREADLSDAVCAGINLQGADLRRANLSHADITGGNLAVAKLRHSSLKNTCLNGANLRGADLAGASFEGASLQDADFTGANLLSTDFVGTDISRSKGLNQGQFDQAMADATTRLPGSLHLPPIRE
ncbi:MAG: pentapeptide repeat-containing protein [Rhodospirillales bacterium]|nr:pentapeptide repeat-containing protein [Rhodospirillales bacterium]